MSALRQHVTHWTIDEYLAFENHANSKHEFLQGSIYAMAGSTPQHTDISLNTAGALRAQLRGKPCSARGLDQRLRVEEADLTTYPDIVVVCPPEKLSDKDRIAFTDATVIIEVLSPSTAQYDKTSKFEYYSYLSSFRNYLLVEQSRIEVEHRFRDENGHWATQIFRNLDDEIALPAIDCTLKLSDIYEEIAF
ncbi:Uma2 family endonuclease [bacterium]|nr:MAG: Uma2 family endonuclease [bacterium]